MQEPRQSIETKSAAPVVVCRLGDRLFAVSSELVESMVQLPPVTRVPQTPEYVRGVINLRGRILRVIDLRRRLGIPTLLEESTAFTDMLDLRLNDHRKWISALKQSVDDGTEFTGEIDPTKCGFGRWYETFETSDPILRAMFERFDKPHRQIHQVAREVSVLMTTGNVTGAQTLVRETEHNELRVLEHLFRATKDAYLRSCREIAIVVGRGGAQTATVVDQVVAVEHILPIDDADVAASIQGPGAALVSSIGKRPRSETELVFTLLENVVLEV